MPPPQLFLLHYVNRDGRPGQGKDLLRVVPGDQVLAGIGPHVEAVQVAGRPPTYLVEH